VIHDNALTQQVIGCAVEVHRTLGPGLLEGIYEACLCHELTVAGLAFLQQHRLPVVYKGHPIDYDMKIDALGRADADP
jgi:GxxExxY protein